MLNAKNEHHDSQDPYGYAGNNVLIPVHKKSFSSFKLHTFPHLHHSFFFTARFSMLQAHDEIEHFIENYCLTFLTSMPFKLASFSKTTSNLLFGMSHTSEQYKPISLCTITQSNCLPMIITSLVNV